jgi:hypothetical protein
MFRIHDANFKAYEKAHDWLSSYESFSNGMWQDREYALLPYLPYTLTPFYTLFATKGGPKLERPKMDWEVGVSYLFYPLTILIGVYSSIGVPKTEDV